MGGYDTGIFFVRVIFAEIVILMLRLVSVRKVEYILMQVDKITKIDFLNRIRISNETLQAYDKMVMLMPDFIIERISNFEITSNFLTDDAGEIVVLFCDICDFDEVIKECQSSVVDIMDIIFREFDSLCKKYKIQKIETVGKTYMAAGGLKFIESQIQNSVDVHFSIRIVLLAKEMLNYLQQYNYKPGKHLKAKIGIHFGGCIFGVLGYHKPQFSLIGDTVNTTSRVCTTGTTDSIVLSREAHSKVQEVLSLMDSKERKKLLKEHNFAFRDQVVSMKGKGDLKVYKLKRPGDIEEEQVRLRSTSKKTLIANRLSIMDRSPLTASRFTNNIRKRSTLGKSNTRVNDYETMEGMGLLKVNSEMRSGATLIQKSKLSSEDSQSEKDSNSQRLGLIKPQLIMPGDDSEGEGEVQQPDSFRHILVGDGSVEKDEINRRKSIALGGIERKIREETLMAQMSSPKSPLKRHTNHIDSKKIDKIPGIGRYLSDGRQDLELDLIVLNPSDDLKKSSTLSPQNVLQSPVDGDEPINLDELESPTINKERLNVLRPPPLDINQKFKAKSSKDIKISKAFDYEDQPAIVINPPIVEESKEDTPQNILEVSPYERGGIFSNSPENIEPVLSNQGSRIAMRKKFGIANLNKKETVLEPEGAQGSPLKERRQSIRRPLGTIINQLSDLDEINSNEGSEGSEHKNSEDDEDNMGLEDEKSSIRQQPVQRTPIIEEEFRKKNKLRWEGSANFCLGLLIVDSLLAEFYYYTDKSLSTNNFKVIQYLVILAFILMILMKVQIGNQFRFKILILSLFSIRTLADFVSMYTATDKSPDKLILQLKMIGIRSMVETMYLLASGLFFPIETIIINMTYFCLIFVNYMIFDRRVHCMIDLWELLAFYFFNIAETYSNYQFEFGSFCNILAANKLSIQVTNFANRLLPRHMQQITELKSNSETYKDVTILFADIVGYTAYSAGKAGRQVVEMLSKLFTEFDKECNRLNLFKLYTIGDCYVVMGFLDKNNRKNPAEEANDVVQLGLSLLRIINQVRSEIKFDKLNMRIGIHTGSMIYGGLIGTDIVRFDLYGPDLVIANKMESGGEPGQINISQRTKDLLEELQTINYTFEENKIISVKSAESEIMSYFVRYSE